MTDPILCNCGAEATLERNGEPFCPACVERFDARNIPCVACGEWVTWWRTEDRSGQNYCEGCWGMEREDEE